MVQALFDLHPLLPALEADEPIITANDRLRRHLVKAWDEHQLARGKQAWPAPSATPLNRWLENHWQTLVERGYPGCQFALAGRPQRQLLWEQVIAQSDEASQLLQAEPLAQQADAALRSLTLWQIDIEQLRADSYTSGNTESFLRWLAVFEQRLEARGLITPEAAHQIVARAFDDGALPRHSRLWLTGFDDLPPLHRQIIESACDGWVEQAGGMASASEPQRVQLPDAETELRAAALWSFEQLQQTPDATLGIIVPDLGQRRDQVERVFAEVFEPTAALPDRTRYTLPFNFSAGIPLGGTPLVHSGLSLLELLRDHWPLNNLCTLLQSPFWGDAEAELVLRTQLCERLRRLGKFELTGSDLRFYSQQLTEKQPDAESLQLARRLQQLDEQRRRLPRSTNARQWAQSFRESLAQLGWPGPRRLDSQEFQQLGQWFELLETFATLEATGTDLTLAQALKQLSQLAGQTPFQAQTPDSPIQILGALEGAGLRFSHCWVLGLHQRQWPPVPAPNPLLPLDLQRREQMPHATAERELSIARSLTENYQRCAEQVVFSSPSADDQGDLSPSPLIRSMAEIPLEELLPQPQSHLQRYRQALRRSARLQPVRCERGPTVDLSAKAPGGSGLFKHQAACPFNAFAQLRLGARAPDAPVVGLSAAERGTVLHGILAAIWGELRNSEQLHAAEESYLRQQVEAACTASLEPIRQRRPRELGPEYCALEHERLTDMVLRWLALEKTRPPFEVIAREERRDIDFAGLKLTLFIDRIDRLDNGEQLLIDYKTGADLNPQQWLGERPDEPQLPLYAVTASDEVKGVAFAQLNPKALQWIGLGELQSPLPGLKPADPDWAGQRADWQQVLEQLAEDFIAGDARVDFKDAKSRRYSEELIPLNRALETDTLQDYLRQEGR
ncbi:PD-(D/E)XK nuclease family protein [Marinimicrobium sp. C2-29]|uniref:PD-(D/E)XK nuclease family protein n=1 Tax=Marinimicrobium sp. C2-29 TaxID=3139825 RepID=UPI003139DCCE